jgi:hypothetical protein
MHTINNSLIANYQYELDYRDSISRRDSLIHKEKKTQLKSRINKYKRQRNLVGIGAGVLAVIFLLIN